jgi:hypothetical protein
VPAEPTPEVSQPRLPTTQAPAATPVQSAAVSGGDQCPSCGALLAADQRYCLQCGQRRGDPRLPFMDAVVLMEATQHAGQAPPPPPKKKSSGISPNAALLAGIGVLLLALGIGVLIGRSGERDVAATAPAPQVVTVGGSGEEETAATGGKNSTGGGNAGKAKTMKQKGAALKESESHPAAEEVLKPAGNVDLPEAKVQPGDACKEGEAGCENGKFNGSFFGE